LQNVLVNSDDGNSAKKVKENRLGFGQQTASPGGKRIARLRKREGGMARAVRRRKKRNDAEDFAGLLDPGQKVLRNIVCRGKGAGKGPAYVQTGEHAV